MIRLISDLQFDLDRRELSRDGTPIHLTKLNFKVLRALVEAAPGLLKHDELIDQVWGENRVITPENLTQRIKVLREALGDDANQPIYIEAVRGQGFRLLPDVEAVAAEPTSTSVTAPSKNRRRLFGLSVVATVVALLTWFISERFTAPDNTPNNKAVAKTVGELPRIDLLKGPTVAVLPFVNISEDPNNEFFGDGISEEIINTLVRQTKLPTIARTSSFQFKNQQVDGKHIGERLGATHLLEGSVRKSGQRVRITAQLIDAPSGIHLWSNQYDRLIDNIFEIQTEISTSIVDEIKRQLSAQGEERIQGAFTYSEIIPRGKIKPEAYEAYLKGLALRSRLLPDKLGTAIDLFEEAIRLEPGFEEAWLALLESQSLATSVHFLLLTPGQVWSNVDRFLDAAEQYNFSHPRIPLYRGFALALNEYRWKEGLEEIARALPKIENDAVALALVAAVLYMPMHDHSRAGELAERAYALNPSSPIIQFVLSWLYSIVGRQQDALDLLQSDDWPYFTAINRVIVNWRTGDVADLDKNIRKAEKYVGSNHNAIRTFRSELLRLRGDHEAAEVLGGMMVDEMEEKPMVVGWSYIPSDRFAEALAIAERQRQGQPFYWLMYGPTGPLREPYYSIYFKKLKLDEFPTDINSDHLWRPDDEQQTLLDSAMPMEDSEFQRLVGTYRSNNHEIRIFVDEGSLQYRRRFVGASLVPVSENKFVSLIEPEMEVEFFTNQTGEYDLCIWRDGQQTSYGYRDISGSQ